MHRHGPASQLASKGIPLINIKGLDLHQALDRLGRWMDVLEMRYVKEKLPL